MKPIKDFPGYFLTKEGVVMSRMARANQPRPKSPRVVASHVANGYRVVKLARDGKSHKRYIHRLLLETFVRQPKPKEECRHLDGNRLNCDLKNLTWGTRRENQNDRVSHGTDNRGERHAMRKLSKKDVITIRAMAPRVKREDIAKAFGVSKSNVDAILRMAAWKHV